MKVLHKSNRKKSIVKRFSLLNFSFEINYSNIIEDRTIVFTLLFQRKYKKEKELFISNRIFGIAHQVIDQRNRLSTHSRKQILKQVNYGE